MDIQNKTLLTWALYYHSLGWSVIPLLPGQKTPCIPEWKQYQNKRANELQIHKWFGEEFPNANIGIVAGKISKLAIIDIDVNKNTGLIDKEFISKLPVTLKVKTGGNGFHYYFRYPDESLENAPKNIKELVELKRDGQYVVVPPSVHPDTGQEYEWLVYPEKKEIDELPDWILKEIKQPEKYVKKDLSGIFAGVEEGERHNAATSIVGELLNIFPEGKWDSRVWPILTGVNQLNIPPLEIKELTHIFDDISEKERAKRNSIQELIPLTTSDLLNTEIRDIEWVVERLIQDQGITIISARPGQGKTWIAMALAKAVALGEKLFGQFNVKKTAVLFIDEENPLNTVISRIKMLGMTHETSVIWLIGKGIKVTSDAQMEAVMKICKENSVGLLIFDSLIRIIQGSDENDSGSMAKVFDQIRKFTKNNISVLITHHHRKDGFGKTGSHLRGSSDILAAIDYHLAIEKDDSEITVEQTKARQSEELPPFKLNFEVNQDTKNVSINYAGEDDSSARQILEAKDVISEMIGLPIARKEIVNKLKDQFPTKIIDLALNQLTEDEVIKMTSGRYNQHIYSKVYDGSN